MQTFSDNRFLDQCGVALSGLCIVHCLAVPVALALLPVLGMTVWADLARAEWLHAALLVPVAIISGTAIGRRARHAGWPAPLLLTAFVMMAGALLVDAHWLEQALTVAGATLLIIAHGHNLRSRRPR